MDPYPPAIANDEPTSDLERLHELIRSAVPDLPDDGNGYGPFHYRYASGREGDAHRIAVAERKHGISLYVLALTEDGEYLAEARAAEFPKANVGKSCIRFKRLDDLDLDALRALLEEAGRLPAPGAV
jgi:uncharacterized protein DUF1801